MGHQDNSSMSGFTLSPPIPNKLNKASTHPSLDHIPEEKQSPKYGQTQTQKQSFSHHQNQTKLSLTIKNDTFMGRLSHPKWWMDGHFNHIPNKIRCKDSVSIDITGDIDTPLVGLLCFTLTLDPRYTHQQNNAKHAFSPYVSSNHSNSQFPHIPPWIIGPGGLPYIPPSVTRLYELQHNYIHKINELQNEKTQKMAQREQRKRQKAENKQQRIMLK